MDSRVDSPLTSTRQQEQDDSNHRHTSYQQEQDTPLDDSAKQDNWSQGNDHNIWGNNSNQPSGSHYDDEPSRHYSLQSSADKNKSEEQPMSPGQYFGARSLPLESMDDIWQQAPPPQLSEPQLQSNFSRSPLEPQLLSNHSSVKIKNILERSWRSSYEDPLWNHFKPLPTSLHHRHQWQSQKIDRSLQMPSYTLHPKDKITIRCQVSSGIIHTHDDDGRLTLINHHAQDPVLFSLFSAKGHVTFDTQSGSVSPGESLDISIKPRLLERTCLDETVVILVGQDHYRLQVTILMDLQDTPCPFCVLETLYPT